MYMQTQDDHQQKALTLKQKKDDISFLLQQIEQIHKDPYRNIDKQAFQNSLKESVNTKNKFFPLKIQESLAQMKDAHTKVNNIVEDWFPIELQYLSDNKCYIIGGKTKDDPAIGGELISINNYPLKEINTKLSALSSKENQEQLLKDLSFFTICNTILNYYSFSSGKITTFTTTKGIFSYEETKELQPKTRNPFAWKDKNYVGNQHYRFKLEKGILNFQYNNCKQGDYSDRELKDFKKELLSGAKDAKYILVDLRQNSGGSTEIMRDALDKLPKNKPIYVATSPKTFSSAMHHLIDLKERQRAIQIGENAGQRPNRFGQGEEIILPNSHIVIHCSSKDFNLMPGSNLEVLTPDIFIPLTIHNYIEEKDPLIDWLRENLI